LYFVSLYIKKRWLIHSYQSQLYSTQSSRWFSSPKGNYPLLLKMMGICILLTCTLLKLCLTQVLFKRRIQVKCLIWHDCVMFINKMLLIFCSVFTLYNWLITFSCFLFVFLLVDFGSFHSCFDNVINDSFNYSILSLDIDETVANLSIEFSGALLHLVARLFMFLLIFNEQRVLKFISF
jgi:hypothetical protein